MPRLARVPDGDAPHPLYLVVACPDALGPRVHCYRVVVARPDGQEDRLVAYCPARLALVPAEELVPRKAAFDLLANPSGADLAAARERLERALAEGDADDEEGRAGRVAIRLVELEIRALVRRSENLVVAMDRGEEIPAADRLGWLRDRERARGLFRRWSRLTGVPVLFDFDVPDA